VLYASINQVSAQLTAQPLPLPPLMAATTRKSNQDCVGPPQLISSPATLTCPHTAIIDTPHWSAARLRTDSLENLDPLHIFETGRLYWSTFCRSDIFIFFWF